MADAFPNYSRNLSRSTRITPDTGVRLTPSDDGTQRGQAMYDSVQYTINADYQLLSITDRNVIEAFIIAHLGEQVIFTLVSGESYLVQITGWTPTPAPSGLFWTLNVTMTGTRQ